jgi:MFS family permease
MTPIPLSRNRDFRRLWVSQTLSMFGSGASYLAYPLLVLALTGSAARAGLVGTVSGVTSVACQLPAGSIVDRFDRRRVMLACQALQCAAVGILALLILSGEARLWMIVTSSVVGAAAGPVFRTAEQAALRHIVAVNQLPSAISLNEARSHSADLAGPAAGGALFGVARPLPFGLDAISFVISFFAVALIRKPLQEHRDRSQRGPWTREIGEAIRFVVRDPFLRAVAIIAPPLNAAITCIMFVLIVVLQRQGTPPAMIGLAESAIAVGGLAGAFLTPLMRRRFSDPVLIISLFWALAVLISAMAAFTGSYLVVLPLVFALLLAPAANAAVFGYQLAITPDRLQGRVSSVLLLFVGGIQPLAPLAGGLLVETWGGRTAIIACGAVLAGAAVAATLSRGIRNMRPIGDLGAPTEREPAAV